LGRIDNPHNRRLALSRLASKDAMRALFAFAPEQFKDRSSGYSPVSPSWNRRLGDGAEMAIIELL
jgi:large subunit ribosomal protein L17